MFRQYFDIELIYDRKIYVKKIETTDKSLVSITLFHGRNIAPKK